MKKIHFRFEKKMANHVQTTSDFLNEIFANSDSDESFDGFEDTDIIPRPDNDENDLETSFDMNNWRDGDRNPTHFNFTATPGMNDGLVLPENPQPVDYLNLFLHQSDFETMASETNRYARTFLETAVLKPKSRFHAWVETTWQEMKLFFAMTIAMGLLVQLDVSEYWSTNEVVETPFFRKCMPRDRFWLLMAFFHLADNSQMIRRGLPGFDALYKLGNVYKNVVRRFDQNYTPHQQLSLDEGMVPWRGNLSFKVYNPDKPKKYGIKAYMICDGHNGYCSKFKLYTGKANYLVESGYGATYDLVMDMMRNYYGKGYILYMDNYYSSPQLYHDLWLLGVGASGTLRSNRKGIPQMAKDKIIKEKGELSAYHNDNLLLVKYNDRKLVYLLSTVDKATRVATGKTIPRTGEPIMKPQVVANYNKYMGGVDRSDQMVSYATFQARTLKWWKRVIFHVLSLTTLNAYLLYKTTTQDAVPMLHRQFRKKLVESIASSVEKENIPGLSTRSVGRPTKSADPIFRLIDRHFPSKILGTGKKKNISRACGVCEPAERQLLEQVGQKRKRNGRESSFECNDCRTALCVHPCFRIYHTHKDFIGAYLDYKRQNQDD